MVIAPPNDGLGLAICEGVEDAIAVHLATGLGAWAAGGTAFMPALAEAVPFYIGAITVCAHPEPQAQEAAEELAQRLAARAFEADVQTMDQQLLRRRAA